MLVFCFWTTRNVQLRHLHHRFIAGSTAARWTVCIKDLQLREGKLVEASPAQEAVSLGLSIDATVHGKFSEGLIKQADAPKRVQLLVESLGSGNLQHLALHELLSNYELTGLVSLPWSIRSLRFCHQDVSHGNVLAHLTDLQELDLSGCFRLTDLSSLVHLPLEALSLKNCKMLQTIHQLALISSLTSLDLRGCVQLISVNSLAALPKLWECRVDCNSHPSAALLEVPKLRGPVVCPICARLVRNSP